MTCQRRNYSNYFYCRIHTVKRQKYPPEIVDLAPYGHIAAGDLLFDLDQLHVPDLGAHFISDLAELGFIVKRPRCNDDQ